MGHGKKRSSGVSQLALGFKVPAGTLLGCYTRDLAGAPLSDWEDPLGLTYVSYISIRLL